jgi:hypothetical protein
MFSCSSLNDFLKKKSLNDIVKPFKIFRSLSGDQPKRQYYKETLHHWFNLTTQGSQCKIAQTKKL